eukprot:11560927-Alexandrium_andersonii.AAC.1
MGHARNYNRTGRPRTPESQTAQGCGAASNAAVSHFRVDRQWTHSTSEFSRFRPPNVRVCWRVQ